jgi:hypothetical protein
MQAAHAAGALEAAARFKRAQDALEAAGTQKFSAGCALALGHIVASATELPNPLVSLVQRGCTAVQSDTASEPQVCWGGRVPPAG